MQSSVRKSRPTPYTRFKTGCKCCKVSKSCAVTPLQTASSEVEIIPQLILNPERSDYLAEKEEVVYLLYVNDKIVNCVYTEQEAKVWIETEMEKYKVNFENEYVYEFTCLSNGFKASRRYKWYLFSYWSTEDVYTYTKVSVLKPTPVYRR
jgi:hypothetical protein